MSAEDAKHFSEDYSKPPLKPEETNYWFYGNLALIAAGAAIWRRRDIAKAVRKTEAGLVATGERRLSSLPPEQLRLATNLLEQANYARSINLDTARVRAQRTTTLSKEAASRLMRQNAGLHSKSAQRALTAAARDATTQDKRDLRTGARLARRARRIANHKR
jgi:hypothetical protein